MIIVVEENRPTFFPWRLSGFKYGDTRHTTKLFCGWKGKGNKKTKKESSGMRTSLVPSDEEFNESLCDQSFRQDDRVLF